MGITIFGPMRIYMKEFRPTYTHPVRSTRRAPQKPRCLTQLREFSSLTIL